MSLPINPPNATQPSLTISSVITPETIDTYTTSNYVSNISNILDNKINTKQNILTASTTLLGIGSSITNIEYGNVINKPTNFPTDWNTTVSNKPSTFPADMTNIYNKTEVNTISNNNSNYTSTTSNILSNLIITNDNNNSNYTSITSNILNTKIDVNNINISNILYSPNYTDERQYPPKAYTSSTGETTTSVEITNVLPTNVYKQTITLDNTNITYGSGDYILYSSSVFTTGDQSLYRKRDLFNYDLNDVGGHWNNSYNGSTGIYNGNNYIKSDYLGDWIIIKLSNPIFLQRFRFYARLSYINQAPSAWRCYGSNDGNNWIEINSASNDTTPLTSASYDANRMYEKIVNSNTSYIYIGFTFNKKIIDASQPYLCFAEIQLFGKEQLILPVYISSNVLNSTLTNTSNTLKGFIDTKENILTFDLPLTRTTNTIGINLGSYSTTGNDANYLLKSGGIMTGAINSITNVGIGTTNAAARLHIREATGTTYNPNNGTIILDHDNNGGASSILFRSAVNRGGDYGYIQYQDAATVNGAGEAAKLIIGTQNDGDDDILLLPSGNVGINTNASIGYKLNVNGSINSTSLFQNGTQIDFSSYLLKSGGVMTGNLEISKTTPTITLRGAGGSGAIARLNLSTYDFTTNEPPCSIITTDDGNFGSSFDIRLKTPGALANSQTSALFIKNDRNVGIGTHTPGTRLHIEHSSTTFNGASGGLYLFNPNNTANSSSCLGARIGGPLANKAGVSLDVSGQYGWSMYINGNDTTNKRLIFNSSWDGAGSERLTIRGNDGNVGISTNNPDCRLSLGSSIGFKVLSLWDNGQTNNFQFVGFGNNGGLCFNTNTNTDAFQFRVGVNSTSATELMRLGGNGNLSIGTTDTATYKLNVNGNIKTTDLVLYNSTTSAYQLLVSGPSSTGPAIIQTVQQGVNFNQNIVFQNSGGNVGIGTLTNITEKLFVNGNIKATNLIANTRITAEGDVRSPLITVYNSAVSSYEIYINAPSATTPAVIQTIQQGTGFNQSLTIQAAGTGTVSIGTTSVGTYKLNVNGSINSTSLWQNSTQIDFSSYATNTNLTNNYYTKTTTDNLLNNKQNTLTFNSPLSLTGNTLSFNESAITTLTNFYNKTTSDGIYVKIQSDTFVQKSGDTMTGSLIVNQTIYGNNGINIVGDYVGSINVAKRATFAFVPLVNLSRRQYVLPLTYINGNGSGYGTQYIFRVHVWTSTGDFGASGNDVETMSYFVFLSPYDGMKIRIETIYNNSNGSLIQSHTATSLLYNGAPTTGGASEKYCVIENISGY